MNTQTEWPEGVLARYLTTGGATVDIRDEGEYIAQCTGCTAQSSGSSDWDLEYVVRPWTQEHAEKCRAMPKPQHA